ncbi:MAG: ATP-binding cassette domain-containing protein [Betaproteobacteria bacterium]
MSLLLADGLRKHYGGVRAVDGVSFALAPGEFAALIGPNGAGKSTLFALVAGQQRADAGALRFDGTDLDALSAPQRARLGIGRTFQSALAFASMTVRENVQTALAAHGGILARSTRPLREVDAAAADALLARVGLAAQAARAAADLAYPDLKRLELAIALAGAPRLLLMDEPTAGMATAERFALMDLVRDVAAETGLTVLFTEHSMEVVFGYARRVLVLSQGRLIADGAPDVVRASPQARAAYFADEGEASEAQRVRLIAAREPSRVVAPTPPPQPSPACGGGSNSRPCEAGEGWGGGVDTASQEVSSNALLALRKLNAYYGRAQALFDLELEVAPGEVLALVGRNGAGKSTTLKAVMGLVRATGEFRLGATALGGLAPHDRARAGLGYVPQDRRIFADLTVLENLRVGSQGQSLDLDALLQLFPNLRDMLDRPAARISGGEQQMLAVARTLAARPRVVLLDEPSEGIAPRIVAALADAVLQLKEQGVAVLLSEQNPHFVARVADRALLLDQGRVVGAATRDELAQPSEAVRAVLGLGSA